MAEMRFSLSYARMRAAKYRAERLRQVVKTDGHASAMWRVNGPLSDFDGFAKTLGCEAGAPVVRADMVRLRIW